MTERHSDTPLDTIAHLSLHSSAVRMKCNLSRLLLRRMVLSTNAAAFSQLTVCRRGCSAVCGSHASGWFLTTYFDSACVFRARQRRISRVAQLVLLLLLLLLLLLSLLLSLLCTRLRGGNN